LRTRRYSLGDRSLGPSVRYVYPTRHCRNAPDTDRPLARAPLADVTSFPIAVTETRASGHYIAALGIPWKLSSSFARPRVRQHPRWVGAGTIDLSADSSRGIGTQPPETARNLKADSLRCCESTSEESSAGELRATFCGSRRRVTASGDPVGAGEPLFLPRPSGRRAITVFVQVDSGQCQQTGERCDRRRCSEDAPFIYK